jgi:hypothetical protein
MFTAADILVGFVLPAVACGAILMGAWRPWQRSVQARDGRWAGAIAIGVGYSIAYTRLVGDLSFPPGSADNWILYFMPVAMGVGLLFCAVGRAPLLRVLVVMAVCAVLNWLLLRPLIGESMAVRVVALWIAAGTIAMTLWWVLLTWISRSGPRLLGPVIAMIVAAGGAVILGNGGLAQRGGFTLGALAVVMGATVVVAAISPQFSLAGGGALAVMLVVWGTMVYGYHYIYPEPGWHMTSAMGIVLAAPALAGVIRLPSLRRRSAWVRGMAGTAAVLVAVAAGVVLANVDGRSTSSQRESYTP